MKPKAKPEIYTASRFIKRLKEFQSPEHKRTAEWFFKTGKGEYGEGDIFLGVRNGPVNALAKEFVQMPLNEVEKLLESPIHEIRSGGLGILDIQARRKKTSEERKKEIYDLYFRCIDHINNWDLVDKSAPHIVGGYLFNKPRDILYELVYSENLWHRRIAMISTLFFIREKDLNDAFKIAEILLHDTEDLIHKATGWMLRSAGDIDKKRLISFLEKYAATMPRTALRYAIEHFEPDERIYFLGKKKK